MEFFDLENAESSGQIDMSLVPEELVKKRAEYLAQKAEEKAKQKADGRGAGGEAEARKAIEARKKADERASAKERDPK